MAKRRAPRFRRELRVTRSPSDVEVRGPAIELAAAAGALVIAVAFVTYLLAGGDDPMGDLTRRGPGGGPDPLPFLLAYVVVVGLVTAWLARSAVVADAHGVTVTSIQVHRVSWEEVAGVRVVGRRMAGQPSIPRLLVRDGRSFVLPCSWKRGWGPGLPQGQDQLVQVLGEAAVRFTGRTLPVVVEGVWSGPTGPR